jgi:hypothetical protein
VYGQPRYSVDANCEFSTIKEAAMMSRIVRSAMLVFGLSALVGVPTLSGSALAANQHVSEAVEHAQGAASHGKEGHADACVQHAEEALKHAKAAGMKNPHVDEGIKHLTEAVKHGKAGHADACTEHADGAAMHLAEAK